jgi:predicted nucleic acid-binding protein
VIVPDASVAVEYLLQTSRGSSAAPLLEADELVAPELLDAEVLSVVRRWVLRGELQEARARELFIDLAAWRVTRIRHRGLVDAAFDLRMNYSAYDALYVAVAQQVGARLVTCDSRLTRAPALAGVEIQVVA